MDEPMQQESLSLEEFQERFFTEEACREHLFHMRWPEGYTCPRCGHERYYLHGKRHLYECKACRYQASLTAGTIFHGTRTSLKKWFWTIFLIARPKSGISMLSLQRMLKIKSYKTVWLMGHKIRKAMADRDSHYRLAGLVEMDDSYFGGSKPGKEGRGALGKAKVIVSVENKGRKAGFAKMDTVDTLSSKNIRSTAAKHLTVETQVRTDGWLAYRSALAEQNIEHEYVVVGSGKEAPKLLPWVHTMLSNIKGNIKGVYKGVANKHLQRYLDEFCYRFNRRFWEDQLFDRLLCACLSTPTITFSELRE
jgi:transposase-like protein